MVAGRLTFVQAGPARQVRKLTNCLYYFIKFCTTAVRSRLLLVSGWLQVHSINLNLKLYLTMGLLCPLDSLFSGVVIICHNHQFYMFSSLTMRLL